jgi:hypothetical protein
MAAATLTLVLTLARTAAAVSLSMLMFLPGLREGGRGDQCRDGNRYQ